MVLSENTQEVSVKNRLNCRWVLEDYSVQQDYKVCNRFAAAPFNFSCVSMCGSETKRTGGKLTFQTVYFELPYLEACGTSELA